MKTVLLLPLLACALLLGGCSDNPTNEPSAAAIVDAKAKRAASIDNDASLTPQQKEGMKSALGLNGAQGGQKR